MWYILLFLVILISGTFGNAQPAVDQKVLADLKKDARVFERIIGEVLRLNFRNPFAVAAEPQASYLPGYGVAISFHLKINRATIRGFGGDLPNPAAPDERSQAEQLETVRKIMLQALADYGGTMKHLDAGERVSICAHVEDRNELNLSKNRKDLVFSATKGDIDLYLTRRISREDFEKRVQLLEY